MADRPLLYILHDKTPIPTKNPLAWAEWYGERSRRVAKTVIGVTGIEVSTVFLGIDTGILDQPVRLFETMVFGGEYNLECHRCETWEQAEQQHTDLVYKLTALYVEEEEQ